MIDFDDALSIVMQSVRRLDAVQIRFDEAPGRVLAEDVASDVDVPPYDKAMVDGFACRANDLQSTMNCVGTIAAGYSPERGIGPGECMKIMTGAPIPEGADTVFMVEHSEQEGDSVRFVREETNRNIVNRGKDVRTGDIVLSAGHRLSAQDVPALATAGATTISVSYRPKVAIVATGDELVEPEVQPSPAQIRNSNAYQLAAQVRAAGAVPIHMAIARDSAESLQETFEAIPDECDVLLFSGGVSMGEFDLVPAAMKVQGLVPQFEKIKIQPGKPTVFATADTRVFFGLPGNPVATFVIFELLVKPYLLATMGHDYKPITVSAELREDLVRRNGARKAWVPVRFDEDGRVAKLDYHGSAHIHAYRDAHGMIAFPEGVTDLSAGDTVRIRMLGH